MEITNGQALSKDQIKDLFKKEKEKRRKEAGPYWEFKETAMKKALSLGYAMGPWEKNGRDGNVWVAKCTKSGALLIIDANRPSHLPIIFGEAYELPCPTDCESKEGEFPRGELSEEFKKKIGRFWKHPAEK